MQGSSAVGLNDAFGGRNSSGGLIRPSLFLEYLCRSEAGLASRRAWYVADFPPERSPMAVALEWSTTVMTIAAEMVVPGLIGHWLDTKLNLKMPVLLLIGFALGGLLAALSLSRIAKSHGGRQ
jgi:hypothetical protein